MSGFTYDEVLDLWIAERKFLDYSIQVRLYCGKDADLQQLTTNAINEVGTHWALFKDAIVNELLPQYRDHASEDISGDDFFARLTLNTIDFDAVDLMYTLFLSDGDLLGGHGIQVVWDPEKDFNADVSLVG